MKKDEWKYLEYKGRIRRNVECFFDVVVHRQKEHSALHVSVFALYSSFYLWSRLDHYWSNVCQLAGSSFLLVKILDVAN